MQVNAFHDDAGSQSRSGLAKWMIPPARGWRRKTVGMIESPLFLPLVGLAVILYGLGIVGFLMTRFLEHRGALFVGQLALLLLGIMLIGVILYRMQRHLLEPLAHMRNWAMRMRGGNLAARIPVPRSGEFAELARDINSLAEGMMTLSRDLDSQVRKQTERLAQKTRSLEFLYDVAASINMSRDLDDLLTLFLHTLKELVHARAATVRLLTGDGQMRLVASIGLQAEVVERERLLPMHRCLCGNAAARGEVRSDSSVSQCAGIIGRPLLDDENTEIIAVPLQYQGRTLGVYNLFAEKPGIAAREDMKELLTSIGRHLGMAIEKSRLDDEAKQLTLMQERTALAHELHDSLAQTLHSLRFQVTMLDETLQQETGQQEIGIAAATDEPAKALNSPGGPDAQPAGSSEGKTRRAKPGRGAARTRQPSSPSSPSTPSPRDQAADAVLGKARQEIRQIKGALDQANTELRALLAHFRAPVGGPGLVPAIEDIVARFRKETGILTLLQKECKLDHLPRALEMQVLRIVQEALSNIRKHSRAHTVRLLLRNDAEGQYQVLVEDDGVGLERRTSQGHPGEHVGLCIMQERARCLGGELKVESEPGEGTRVLLNFRYSEDAKGGAKRLHQT